MNATLMIIDDDVEFLDELSELLALSGYEVSSFADGNEALKAVLLSKPDFILLDLNMPSINGFDFTRRIRDIPQCKDIPIAIMTGFYSEDEIEGFLKKYNIKYVFQKPLIPQDILLTIEEMIDHNQ